MVCNNRHLIFCGPSEMPDDVFDVVSNIGSKLFIQWSASSDYGSPSVGMIDLQAEEELVDGILKIKATIQQLSLEDCIIEVSKLPLANEIIPVITTPLPDPGYLILFISVPDGCGVLYVGEEKNVLN